MKKSLPRQEYKWAQILNNIPDIITVHDTDFNIVYANKSAKRILGLPRLSAKGLKCYKYYHGKKEPLKDCPSCKCMRTGKTVVSGLFEPHLDMFLEIKASPQFDGNKRLTGLIHIARNISDFKEAEKELQEHRDNLIKLVEDRTSELVASNELLREEIMDRRNAEQALRLSEKKYRDLYDNAPDMFHSLNKDRIIIDCNETEARMLGYKKEEIIGRPLSEFFTEESGRLLEEDFPKLIKEKELKNIERIFVRKDGTTFPAIINVYAEFNGEGKISGTRAIARDITERKLSEAEKIRVSHLAALGELAAGVAHEINNPVNGIINYAQMLANSSSTGSKERDIAGRIIKESERIAAIVGNLLSFTRSSEDEKHYIHVNDMLSEILALTETQMRKEGIRLMINIPHELPPVFVIPRQIEQVFLNIISNSRYALNKKYRGVHRNKILEITGEQVPADDESNIRITFYDGGTGIPPEALPKVMNPFFSTKPAHEGTGLGLSISHGIVAGHGGKIIFDSGYGKYTKVTVELPVKKNL